MTNWEKQQSEKKNRRRNIRRVKPNYNGRDDEEDVPE